MELKNGYKTIYEVISEDERTFYATKNCKCDPEVDDVVVSVDKGAYKIIYQDGNKIMGIAEYGEDAEEIVDLSAYVEETNDDDDDTDSVDDTNDDANDVVDDTVDSDSSDSTDDTDAVDGTDAE